MISVCMATYNGEKYIEQQLESILLQLEETDEVIISDDGSTDGTKKIIRQFAVSDNRIRLVDGPGKGVIANFENAIVQSSGAFIFLADQDDIWFPDKVSKTIAFFNTHPELEVVVSDLKIVDETLQETAPSYFAYRGVKEGFWTNIFKSGYIGAGMCFKKSLKTTILPIPSQAPMHDMWIGLLAERRHSAGFLREPLTYYRRHNQNTSEIATSSSLYQKTTWRLTLLWLLFKRLGLKR